MIEAYAFLAAFTVQILAWSVLFPAGYTKYARARLASFPPERVAQLYPDMDVGQIQGRYLARYRALNTVIAVLGLLLLGWLFSHIDRPDWDAGPITLRIVALFGMLQMSTMSVLIWFAFKFKITWFGIRFDEMHERALAAEKKRTAVLQRRRLFDFISPFTVSLAVVAYLLFAALAIHIHYLYPDSVALFRLRGVTVTYALMAFVVYRRFHGRKINPLETQADNLHRIGYTVKVCVYSCIIVVLFQSLSIALDMFDLLKWMPFAMSALFVLMALVCSLILAPLPRRSETDELGSSPAS